MKNKTKSVPSVRGLEASFFPRKLARSVAKAKAKRAGIQHINRDFSLNWKNWVG